MITVRTFAAMLAQSRHNSHSSAIRGQIGSIRTRVKTFPAASYGAFEGAQEANGNPPTRHAPPESIRAERPHRRSGDWIRLFNRVEVRAEDAPVPCV